MSLIRVRKLVLFTPQRAPVTGQAWATIGNQLLSKPHRAHVTGQPCRNLQLVSKPQLNSKSLFGVLPWHKYGCVRSTFIFNLQRRSILYYKNEKKKLFGDTDVKKDKNEPKSDHGESNTDGLEVSLEKSELQKHSGELEKQQSDPQKQTSLEEVKGVAHKKEVSVPLPRHVVFKVARNECGQTKEGFLKAIDLFVEKSGRRPAGLVEFVNCAISEMQTFGVARDKEVYKKILSTFPKDIWVHEGWWGAEFMNYPAEQQCCISLFDFGERHGVLPDEEMLDMVKAVFGKHSHAARKVYRQVYWLPKFKHTNPYAVDNKKLKLGEEYALVEYALRRMSADEETEFKAIQYEDPDVNSAHIVSSQSPLQRKLLEQHPADKPLIIEGGFHTWVGEYCLTYFVLKAEVTDKVRNLQQHEEEYAEKEEASDEEDVIPYEAFFSEVPESVKKKREEERQKVLARTPSDHENSDGTIIAMAMTSTSNKRSLAAWLKALEETNPRLSQLPVLFMLRTPEEGVTVWSSDAASTGSTDSSSDFTKDNSVT